MPSLSTIYVIATSTMFCYTFGEKLRESENYFKGIMTYLGDQTSVFIFYNMILSLAIISYRLLTWLFFKNSMEGELVKITEKLRNKIVDLVILAYLIDLKFDLEMYVLVVFVIFTFILHNHLIFRSEYLVHVYSASTSLGLHYRALALYLLLFFFDYQILAYIIKNMLSATKPTEGLFVYYMIINMFSLLQPFMQFGVDFFQKYTFQHIKNIDEKIATISVFINIPRLVAELALCIWLGWRFDLIFIAIIRGFQIISNIKKTFDSFMRIKKLSQTMSLLRKVKDEQLDDFYDLTCTVCYQDMKEAVLLPCKHIFHQECIRQWIIKNLNHFCPKCKHQLNFENAQSLYETKKTKSPLEDLKNLVESPEKHREQDQEPGTRRKTTSDYKSSLRFNPTGNRQEEEERNRSDPIKFRRERQRDLQEEEGRRKREYMIDGGELGDYPLEVYEVMKRKIVAVGSVPYGTPCAAVPNRRQSHMDRRDQYIRDLNTLTNFLEMQRNIQMLLL